VDIAKMPPALPTSLELFSLDTVTNFEAQLASRRHLKLPLLGEI
jgi:hypothetical protein